LTRYYGGSSQALGQGSCRTSSARTRSRNYGCIFPTDDDSSDDSSDEYPQSLLVNEDLISLRSQKRIKLTMELNRYYDAGLKLVKIYNKNGSKVNDVVPDPLN